MSMFSSFLWKSSTTISPQRIHIGGVSRKASCAFGVSRMDIANYSGESTKEDTLEGAISMIKSCQPEGSILNGLDIYKSDSKELCAKANTEYPKWLWKYASDLPPDVMKELNSVGIENEEESASLLKKKFGKLRKKHIWETNATLSSR